MNLRFLFVFAGLAATAAMPIAAAPGPAGAAVPAVTVLATPTTPAAAAVVVPAGAAPTAVAPAPAASTTPAPAASAAPAATPSASPAAPLAPAVAVPAAPAVNVASAAPLVMPDVRKLRLSSANALVFDAASNQPVYSKAANEVTPIASLTKLMTAMVMLDGRQSLDEVIDVDMDDFDYLKGSSSRLRMGAALSRREMLRVALMASENRAASSLARHYPGGAHAFVAAMNAKAAALGMTHSHFEDPTGLTPANVSTAVDLAKMVHAASQYPLIREFSTTSSHTVEIQPTGQVLGFHNTNALVKSRDWDIQVSKTGYIREAGKCLVMLTTISSRPFVIVLLDSLGKYTRVGDAERVKHWLETGDSGPLPALRHVRATAHKAAVKVKARVKGTFSPKYASAKVTS